MTSNLSPTVRAELSRAREDARQLIVILDRLLGDDDPTGLTYSREDDEPAPAPTRPHDGFTVTGRTRPTNSPAGSAFDTVERRTHQFSGRPVSKQGEAGLRGPASPTLTSGSAR